MRIFTLLSVGLLVTLNTQAQQKHNSRSFFGKRSAKQTALNKTEVKKLPQLTMEYSWDSGNSSWGLDDSVATTYDAYGMASTETTTYLSGAQRQYVYTYDSIGRTAATLLLTRDDMFLTWDSTSKTTYSYDQQGNQSLYVEYTYSQGSGWAIDYGYKVTFTYNSSNLPVSQEVETYDGLNYVKESKATFAYDGSGRIVSVTGMDWNGSAYVNESKTGEIVWHKWNPTHVEGSLMKSANEYEWNSVNSTFELSWRYASEYDSRDNEIEYTEETLMDTTWVMEYGNTYEFTYDTSNALTKKIEQSWSKNDSAWVNRYMYEYSNFLDYTGGGTGLRDLSRLSGGVTVYPNPFADQAVVSLTQNSNDAKFMLYDLTGKNIRTLDFVGGNVVLEKGDLPAGVYFYIVADSEKALSTGKLMIR